jgi:hypothetical protein
MGLRFCGPMKTCPSLLLDPKLLIHKERLIGDLDYDEAVIGRAMTGIAPVRDARKGFGKLASISGPYGSVDSFDRFLGDGVDHFRH